MDARTAFVAQSRRLQLTVAAFAMIVFATALIYPRAMIFEWIVGLPLLALSRILQLRVAVGRRPSVVGPSTNRA